MFACINSPFNSDRTWADCPNCFSPALPSIAGRGRGRRYETLELHHNSEYVSRVYVSRVTHHTNAILPAHVQMLCYLLIYWMAKLYYYSYEHDLRDRYAPSVNEHVIWRRRLSGDDAIVTTLHHWLPHASIDSRLSLSLWLYNFIGGIKPTWSPMHGRDADPPFNHHSQPEVQGPATDVVEAGSVGEWHYGGMASLVTAPLCRSFLPCKASVIQLLLLGRIFQLQIHAGNCSEFQPTSNVLWPA